MEPWAKGGMIQNALRVGARVSSLLKLSIFRLLNARDARDMALWGEAGMMPYVLHAKALDVKH